MGFKLASPLRAPAHEGSGAFDDAHSRANAMTAQMCSNNAIGAASAGIITIENCTNGPLLGVARCHCG